MKATRLTGSETMGRTNWVDLLVSTFQQIRESPDKELLDRCVRETFPELGCISGPCAAEVTQNFAHAPELHQHQAEDRLLAVTTDGPCDRPSIPNPAPEELC